MATFKGFIKQCEVCSAEFKVSPSQAHVRACSPKCGYKLRRVANKVEKVELTCWQCEGKFYERPCHANRRVYCSKACMGKSEQLKATKSFNTSGSNNPAWKGGISRHVVSSNGVEYTRRPAHIENEKCARRKSNKLIATPAWANVSKILAIYEIAQEITKLTKVKHHVDHVVPLKSLLVCGLHCEDNLQILSEVDNLKKQNRHWPNMP